MKINSHFVRYILLSAMLLSFFSAPIFVSPAHAAGLVVNTDQEIEADNSLCSLYEAVIAANTDTAYKGCPAGSGADVITFADDFTITTLVPLEILSPITITGRGITNTVIQASDCNPITTPGGCSPANNRVFYIGNSQDVILNDLTIQHGNCTGGCSVINNAGGGILTHGNLTLNNVLLKGNKAEYGGGLGVGESGTTTLNNVTITGNSADSGGGQGGGAYISANTTFTDVTISENTAKYGGGIYFYQSRSYTLLRTGFVNNSATAAGGGIYNNLSNPAISASFFSGNSANFYLGGGGIYNNESNPTLANVTFSGNSAENSYGGGMLNNNSAPVLTNVTFSANFAGTGGGMLNTNGSAPILKNTIIANSLGGGDCVNNSSSLNSSINNLMEDGANACGLPHGVNGNIVGQDPLLGALLNNGGNTLTHALQTGSPAINAGTNTGCPADDQRGVVRPQSIACDIGSYELTYTVFADVPSTYWASQHIERLYNAGITGGCSTTPLNYCPEAHVTRAQMAVFLLVAKHGAGYTPPAAIGQFSDVPASNGFASWIEQMANEGITGGCGGGMFCPNDPVTREQMAVFLLVAKHGAGYTPPAATGQFSDVPVSNGFAPWIEQLAAEGITGGCGGGMFCPLTPVTRAQMAVFLVTAFNLP